MITVTRLLEFDAGHRVHNHESKCATLHGHRYKVEVEASADALDSLGRIIDFSVIKSKLGTWLDENWDHKTLLFKDDERTIVGVTMSPGKPPVILPFNPTAENMAAYLLKLANQLFISDGIRVDSITVWETPNCKATAKR